MVFFEKAIEKIVDMLERRVSASDLVKAEDLVLSNASLKDIKDGINKIYTQVTVSNNR